MRFILSQQRPNPVPWCSTASIWSSQPPWTMAPMSCWRLPCGLPGVTAWALGGRTATQGQGAGRAWRAAPSASWLGWYHARTVETGTEDATGKWVVIGGAKSSVRNLAPAMTSAHCDTHKYIHTTHEHKHTQQTDRHRRKGVKKRVK